MALKIGSRLGHYDVTALIGEGGMGQGGMNGLQLQRWLPMPQIEVHCRDEGKICRFFGGVELWIHAPDSSIKRFHFFTYHCRNCGGSANGPCVE